MRAGAIAGSLVGVLWAAFAAAVQADPPQAQGKNNSVLSGINLASDQLNGNQTAQPSGQRATGGQNGKKGGFQGGPQFLGTTQNGVPFAVWNGSAATGSGGTMKNSPILQGLSQFHEQHKHQEQFAFVKHRERELLHELKKLLEGGKQREGKERREREIHHEIKLLHELKKNREFAKLHELKKQHERAGARDHEKQAGRNKREQGSSMLALVGGGKTGAVGNKHGLMGGGQSSSGGTTGGRKNSSGGTTGGKSGSMTGGHKNSSGGMTGGKSGPKNSSGGLLGGMPTNMAGAKGNHKTWSGGMPGGAPRNFGGMVGGGTHRNNSGSVSGGPSRPRGNPAPGTANSKGSKHK